jgi:hypothetical protein
MSCAANVGALRQLYDYRHVNLMVIISLPDKWSSTLQLDILENNFSKIKGGRFSISQN